MDSWGYNLKLTVYILELIMWIAESKKKGLRFYLMVVFWTVLLNGATAFLIYVLGVFWNKGLEKSDLEQLRVFMW